VWWCGLERMCERDEKKCVKTQWWPTQSVSESILNYVRETRIRVVTNEGAQHASTIANSRSKYNLRRIAILICKVSEWKLSWYEFTRNVIKIEHWHSNTAKAELKKITWIQRSVWYDGWGQNGPKKADQWAKIDKVP